MYFTAILSLILSTTFTGPASDVISDYIQFTQLEQMVIEEAEFFQEENICDFENSEYSRYYFDNTKVYCPEIEDYFKAQYQEIGNLKMRFDGNCQEYFKTSNTFLCLKRAEREITKSSK